jgi:signal peptidase II
MRFWLTALAVLALDQFTKHAVATGFSPGESRIFIPHLLWWTYVQNHAGAFGLFGSQPVLLIGLALAVLGIFWFAFRDQAERSGLFRFAFGAIAGGAFGNIIDRVRLGYVVDFADLRWWPVFNFADSCITLGVALLILGSIYGERHAARIESQPRG